jgi:hypothetical protein
MVARSVEQQQSNWLCRSHMHQRAITIVRPFKGREKKEKRLSVIVDGRKSAWVPLFGFRIEDFELQGQDD